MREIEPVMLEAAAGIDGGGGGRIGAAAAAVPNAAGAVDAVGSGGVESPVVAALRHAPGDAFPAVVVVLADEDVPRRSAARAGEVAVGPAGVAAHAAALVLALVGAAGLRQPQVAAPPRKGLPGGGRRGRHGGEERRRQRRDGDDLVSGRQRH
uniref:Uncharacterized protein n=1 Tax=Oryza brachyantha TaxID=4533 RepID=J3N6J1_ORYBR